MPKDINLSRIISRTHKHGRDYKRNKLAKQEDFEPESAREEDIKNVFFLKKKALAYITVAILPEVQITCHRSSLFTGLLSVYEHVPSAALIVK